MTSTWSPRKFSQAEIDGMRDTEVFGHADSLIMCLEDWDVQVAIAAGKKLATLPPTVLTGFAPALSRSVVGAGLLHRAQQLPGGAGGQLRHGDVQERRHGHLEAGGKLGLQVAERHAV